MPSEKELLKSETLVPGNKTGVPTVQTILNKYYPQEVLKDKQFTNEQLIDLSKMLRSCSSGLTYFTPMKCAGDKCPARDKCSLFKNGLAPIAYTCPIEAMLTDVWEQEYIETLDIDIHNKIERDLVKELVEADIIEMRASSDLARSGLYDYNAIGVDAEGRAIYKKEEAVSIKIKMLFKKRKDKAIEDFLATRKSRVKFGVSKQMDPSRYASSLKERYTKISQNEVMDVEEVVNGGNKLE